jgi:alpha-1,3-rhamnosyl/mannosyltransferase
MRIGFDARMIDHPGIGRYISALLAVLCKYPEEHKLSLFGDPEKLAKYAVAGKVDIVPWELPVYPLWEYLWMGLPKIKIDFLHVPHFNIPLFYGGKMVVTIHDLIYLLFPRSLPSPFARHYARFMIETTLKRADRIIAVSAYTKRDILKHFGAGYGDKITVIHEAVDDVFQKVTDKARIADVKCRYRIGEKVLLYVGTVKPHKNLGKLLDVFAQLKAWGIPHQLVICGRWDNKEDRLKKYIDHRSVLYLGEIPVNDLVVLYNIAEVLVHLSLYEGFGLTVLEAMKCGTPVVVSDLSSLPEVSGKAAFHVDPNDPKKIADTIYNILINPQLRAGMVEAGYENVKRFSWEKTALETLGVYKEVI